jgi:hypothetical protein
VFNLIGLLVRLIWITCVLTIKLFVWISVAIVRLIGLLVGDAGTSRARR